jgi:FkbM family methyltransferase
MTVISYAQNREDVVLNRAFTESSSGFYIDVGACDPVVDSVTKLFYDRGWRGINIEPLPKLSETLARDRKRDINLCIGLSSHEGTSTFYECLPHEELSTFSEERAEVLRRQGFDLEEHSIPLTTLARVCEQHAVQTIDFLKIDVECYEREVLEGADWGRFRPRVVLIEATRPETNIPSYEQWEHLLFEADYLFAFFDGLNRYYVRAEDEQLLPLLGVPANVFDQYDIYDYRRQIQDLQHTFAASQESLGGTQAALNAAQAALADTQAALRNAENDLTAKRRAWDNSQIALCAMLDKCNATRAQLEATQQQLAPFQELGPIAIGFARRMRRMSRKSPRLASIAKRIIRRAHPRARLLIPDSL